MSDHLQRPFRIAALVLCLGAVGCGQSGNQAPSWDRTPRHGSGNDALIQPVGGVDLVELVERTAAVIELASGVAAQREASRGLAS
jgi:hypothetical protein